VPLIRGGEGQIHQVQVRVAVPAGPIQLSETFRLVIDRIAETIFMALVATTVAIPIAAVLSFFAARNLMQQVRLSVGGVLMAFVAFVVGVMLGGRLLAPIGDAAVMLGQGNFAGIAEMVTAPTGVLSGLATGLLVFLGVFSSFRERLGGGTTSQEPDDPATPNRWRVIINAVLFSLGPVLVIGIVGGLAILIGGAIVGLGESFQPATVESFGDGVVNAVAVLVTSIGRLLDIIGTLLELFIGGIGALLAGFALATVAGSLLGSALRRVPTVPSHVLGAALGAFGGALLLGLMALAGLWASLLGLLPLVTAAVLGGALLVQLVRFGLRLAQRERAVGRLMSGRSRRARVINVLLFGAGALITGIYVFGELNLGRTLVDGTLPTQTQQTIFGITLPVTGYVFEAALIGAVLAGIAGGLVGVRSVFPLGSMLYSVSRLSLNIVRSIEPLIMGLVFVVWVGIGPFAGVLALTLHSIAALGKLYSEQIENIDNGPLEALRSTGANHLQTIVYAVVPQIIPPYIAFTMYRWDINVRMSTIIGFVGGGGIGLLLQQQINLLRYRDAGVAVLAIAIVVSILDYASASIRERLT
jgi:phosphonate ABC transporter permease subunit PhnE